VFDTLYGYEFGLTGFDQNPGRQVFEGYGYDKTAYIATAKLTPTPYTAQALIQARLGGLIRLIEACDDSNPPLGQLQGDALAVLNNTIQNVTTEINGFLTSIYPIPLAQTGTVSVIQITGVSTDGLGTVTSIQVLEVGNYLTPPPTTNNVSYLVHLDPLANEHFWGQQWQSCQLGTGLQLTVTYGLVPFADENGLTVNASAVTGTPVIAAGGSNYQLNQLVVLVGGSSFVPAKIRQAALDMICASLYMRRLAPEEKNIFGSSAKFYRDFLEEIGEGDKQLDGTYKRFFSAGSSWNQKSVLFGANSL
jgi:hypothetical protein